MNLYQTLAVSLVAVCAGCVNTYSFESLTPDSNGGPPPEHGTSNDPAPGGTSTGTTTCPLQNVTRPVKLMFVVDASGSNAEETTDNGTEACQFRDTGCAPPTDPQKTFRGGSISAFYSTYQSKLNFSWGFEVFSGSNATPYIMSGNEASFGGAAAMAGAISQFYRESDSDATPYLAALKAARSAIANDPDLNSTAQAPPLYVIVFMSDGYPTDALLNSGAVDQNEIDNIISSIVALAPDRVTLSTIYYGTIKDPVAAGTLQTMATSGGGHFVNIDTSNAYSFSIDDVIEIQPTQCN